jgi:uncharacterized protein
MWSYIIIITVSIAVSALAFFSGFGLGTVLLPAFALFFPVPVAIAATAIVHLVNNIFKSVLIGKKANWHVVLKFALPGALAAIGGAYLLNLLSNIPAITMYRIGNSSHEINVIYGLVLAASLAAITGSITGTLILKKITMRIIKLVVGIMLIIVAAGMISGLI